MRRLVVTLVSMVRAVGLNGRLPKDGVQVDADHRGCKSTASRESQHHAQLAVHCAADPAGGAVQVEMGGADG